MSDNIFKCPKCGSDNIQSYEVIYNSGRASHVSTTDGVSFGSDFSVGHATTSGNSVTHLAQTCAPPVRKIYNGYIKITFYIVLSLFLAMIHPIIGVVAFLFLGFKWYSKSLDIRIALDTEFINAHEQWKHSYYCHKCGNRFIINEDDDA